MKDERAFRCRTFEPLLYIPHGSDERSSYIHKSNLSKELYIPHGSDERAQLLRIYKQYLIFISHMVQMKVNTLITIICSWHLTLYPTWFRWKQNINTSVLKNAPTLYPTWFRWKKGGQYGKSSRKSLYIPHGSDERLLILLFLIFAPIFISHMVQMKEELQESIKMRLDETLYPTWFRWKET